MILSIQKRTITGNQVRKLRKTGLVPGVVYGNKIMENIVISLSTIDFFKVYRDAGYTSVIELKIDNKKIPVIIQEVDLDPVSSKIRHVDFLAVDLKEKISARVPIEITGEAPAIKEFGGVLVQNIAEVHVLALPSKIPHSILIDVTKLANISDSVHLSELIETYPDIEFEDDPDSVLVTISAPTEETSDNTIQTPEVLADSSTTDNTEKK